MSRAIITITIIRIGAINRIGVCIMIMTGTMRTMLTGLIISVDTLMTMSGVITIMTINVPFGVSSMTILMTTGISSIRFGAATMKQTMTMIIRMTIITLIGATASTPAQGIVQPASMTVVIHHVF